MFASSVSNSPVVTVMNLNGAGPGQSASNNRISNNAIMQVASSTANAPSTSHKNPEHDFLVPSDSNPLFAQWLHDADLQPLQELKLNDDDHEDEAVVAEKIMVAWHAPNNDEVPIFGNYLDKNHGLTNEGVAILKRHGYLNDYSLMTWKALEVASRNWNSPANPAVSGSDGDARAKV